MAQTTTDDHPTTIEEHALAYIESFVNGNRETVRESLACLDNHTMAQAVAIAARMMLYMPPK